MNEKKVWFGSYGPHDDEGKILVMPEWQSIAGYTLGIVVMHTWFPVIPGNAQNASTYPFPVLLKKVSEINSERQRTRSDDDLMLEQLIGAGKELQAAGVKAIMGCCGFFGRFQYELPKHLNVPCYMSSLLQVPMVMAGLKPDQKVGIMLASKSEFPFEMLEYLKIDTQRVESIGMEDTKEFFCVCENRGEWDNEKMKADMIRKAQELVNSGNIGAIVMECTDMPAYAVDVQHAVNLPVYDFMTLARWIHSSVCQKPYYGQM